MPYHYYKFQIKKQDANVFAYHVQLFLSYSRINKSLDKSMNHHPSIRFHFIRVSMRFELTHLLHKLSNWFRLLFVLISDSSALSLSLG